ncbi:MAG: type II toxin-antitoxin system RelE/ParE family toxin [Oscillibacter sp.]|nr:type II toxin-antitoxin system RelE/ParE family toxin [Oscillibacter sp.]
MEQFQIIFYTKEDGTQPAREFMDGLSKKMQARFAKLIVLLREEGTRLRMPHSEYLNDGIFQIRAQQEGNITRVLYFFWNGQKIVFTNGFTKKTRKTPPAEIERAKRYRADYERREADGK